MYLALSIFIKYMLPYPENPCLDLNLLLWLLTSCLRHYNVVPVAGYTCCQDYLDQLYESKKFQPQAQTCLDGLRDIPNISDRSFFECTRVNVILYTSSIHYLKPSSSHERLKSTQVMVVLEVIQDQACKLLLCVIALSLHVISYEQF